MQNNFSTSENRRMKAKQQVIYLHIWYKRVESQEAGYSTSPASSEKLELEPQTTCCSDNRADKKNIAAKARYLLNSEDISIQA